MVRIGEEDNGMEESSIGKWKNNGVDFVQVAASCTFIWLKTNRLLTRQERAEKAYAWIIPLASAAIWPV